MQIYGCSYLLFLFSFLSFFFFSFPFFFGGGVWVAGEGSCLFKRLSAHANGN